jgi:hypothetical protein
MLERLFATVFVIMVGFAGIALADRPFPPVVNDTVQYECSDCHMAYQPQMLPQRSWRRLMEGVTDHFGEELSLDAETTQEVLRYHLENAADRVKQKEAREFLEGLRPTDAPIRITETPHWREEHEELPDGFWLDERISFKGQCEACHTEAERGRYDEEDGLRVPGPNGTWRRWEDD